ncbi:Bcebp4 [Penicillium capsulatum]|uniref:Bcebp4 n=1 Tax=Penicillium capsulatum TaxID=69766 RepID=A0A9W9LW47_9EURO|nr:Bcebp4 [Penicillium capsulatum]KAJ6122486.1 Bcebp4 [Penicillium capsulatum]
MSSDIPTPVHPYYPLALEVVGYLPNNLNTLELLSIFITACTGIFALTYLLVKRAQPKIPSSELCTIIWFVLCGCIHALFEGYYVYHFRNMPSKQDIFGQLWKEYSLSDSRYLSQDAFTVAMETVTAVFWGPLSFMLVGMIMKAHPMRHPLQIVVSLGQFYGNVLYYAISLFDHYIHDWPYSRPEPAIFWGYFVLCNAFWIVIPLILLHSSLSAVTKAFKALSGEKSEKYDDNKEGKAE